MLKLARCLCVENAPGVRVFGVYVCANGTSACLLKMFWVSSGETPDVLHLEMQQKTRSERHRKQVYTCVNLIPLTLALHCDKCLPVEIASGVCVLKMCQCLCMENVQGVLKLY